MNKRRLAGVSPWIIIGAVLVLAPIFALMTWQSLESQRVYTTKLLIDRGDALIRSFEAGARTGAGFEWGHFQLQKLLMETAQQPGIDYLVVADANGVILADSDPSQLGETYGDGSRSDAHLGIGSTAMAPDAKSRERRHL